LALLDDRGALTVAGSELLAERLAATAEAIARGLRTIIANRLQPGQAVVGTLENAFEASRKAAHSKATVADLVTAQQALELLGTVLANHSLKDPRELELAKQAASKAGLVVKQLTP
jgi:hypothetical protein